MLLLIVFGAWLGVVVVALAFNHGAHRKPTPHIGPDEEKNR